MFVMFSALVELTYNNPACVFSIISKLITFLKCILFKETKLSIAGFFYIYSFNFT